MGIERPVFISHENSFLYKNKIQMDLVKLMYGDTSNEHFDHFEQNYSKKFRELYPMKLDENPSLLQDYATDPEFKQTFLMEIRKILEVKDGHDGREESILK